MEKRIRLTESELNRIVENSIRRAINEGRIDEGKVGDFFKKVGKKGKKIAKNVGKAAGATALGLAGMYGMLAGNDELHKNDDKSAYRADAETRKEFGSKALSGKKDNKNDSILKQKDIKDKKTRSWTGEARINRAVMESIRRFKKNRL